MEPESMKKGVRKIMKKRWLKSRIWVPTAAFGTTILEPGEEVGGGVNHSSREVGRRNMEEWKNASPKPPLAQRAGGILFGYYDEL